MNCRNEITEKTANRLTLIRETPKRTKSRNKIGLFKCECGVVKEIVISKVRAGETKSCGCLAIEVSKAKGRGKTHGMTGSPEYTAWKGMWRRCNSKSDAMAKVYRNRGISVCSRWDSFEAFYLDMGDRPSDIHSIDRISNDGNYEPGNCRWATWTEQNNNKRDVKKFEFYGENLTIAEWSRVLETKVGRIHSRISRGWTVFEAIFGQKIGPNDRKGKWRYK